MTFFREDFSLKIKYERNKFDNCFLSYMIQVVPLVPKISSQTSQRIFLFLFNLDKYEIFQIIMTLIYCLFFNMVQLMSQVPTLNGAGHPADMSERSSGKTAFVHGTSRVNKWLQHVCPLKECIFKLVREKGSVMHSVGSEGELNLPAVSVLVQTQQVGYVCKSETHRDWKCVR